MKNSIFQSGAWKPGFNWSSGFPQTFTHCSDCCNEENCHHYLNVNYMCNDHLLAKYKVEYRYNHTLKIYLEEIASRIFSDGK